MTVKCDISGLRHLQASLKADGLMGDSAKALAEELITAAAARTPVQTGNLKRGFHSGDGALAASHSGNTIRLEVVNPVVYSSFVEFGHRTENGGWALGRFMLTAAAAQTALAAPKILTDRIRDFWEGCFANT